MTKTLNQNFFFPPPKSEYFFSNIENQNIFLEKKPYTPPFVYLQTIACYTDRSRCIKITLRYKMILPTLKSGLQHGACVLMRPNVTYSVSRNQQHTFRCTFSNLSMSDCRYGSQVIAPYSSVDLTKDIYAVRRPTSTREKQATPIDIHVQGG
jgi:hypothetical protein